MFVQLTKEFLGNPIGRQIHVADDHGRLLVQQGVAQAVDPAADNAPAVMGGYYPGGTFMTRAQFSTAYC